MGTAFLVLGLLVLVACVDGSEVDSGSDADKLGAAELAEAECEGEAEEWVVGFAADAEGEATPKEALDRAQEQDTNPLPSGQPHSCVARTYDHQEYAFADGSTYTGSVTVRHLNSTWLVESALVCR